MEIKLYLGEVSHTFIVSKFIKRFIISLEEISRILGRPNSFEIMRVGREGKLFNFVAETDEKTLSAIVPLKQGNFSFLAQKKDEGGFGFSRFVLDSEVSDCPQGVITLIVKSCDKPSYSGYYLNAFWGYPVEPEPFSFSLSSKRKLKSELFWKKNAYRLSGKSIDTNQILVSVSDFSPETLKVLETSLGVPLNVLGRCSLCPDFKHISIVADGDYFVLRG